MDTNRTMKWKEWKQELSPSTAEKFCEHNYNGDGPCANEVISASDIISAVCRYEGGFTASEMFHYVSEIYGFSID